MVLNSSGVTSTTPLRSITLLGSSSGRNAGDAALIAGIMDAVDTACGSDLLYEIPTIRPSFIKENYRNRTLPIGMMPWNLSLKMLGIPTYQSILRTDFSLIFDAILFDRSLYNPLFNYMSSLSLMLPRAKKAGKKMACYNVGLGPVDSAHGRSMLRDILEMMDFVTVRDAAAWKLIEELEVKNPYIMQAADAALTVKPSDEIRVASLIKKLGFSLEEEIVGVNINAYLDTWVRPKRPSMGKDRFLATYASALNKFAQQTGAPLLFICTQHHDVALTEELRSRINPQMKHAMLTNVEYNHYDIKGVMGRLAMLFGMRLHATILSASALTPTLGIEYQPKVKYFFSLLGLAERCLSFDGFSADSVYEHLVCGWNDRARLRAKLEQRIPELQQEALRPAQMLGALSHGKSMAEAWSENMPSSVRSAAMPS